MAVALETSVPWSVLDARIVHLTEIEPLTCFDRVPHRRQRRRGRFEGNRSCLLSMTDS